MKNLKLAVQRFLKDEEGLTTVEYAIAGGLVGAGVIGAFAALGGNVEEVISAISDAIGGIDIDTGVGG